MAIDSVIPTCDCGKTTGPSKVGLACEHCSGMVKAVFDPLMPLGTASRKRMMGSELAKQYPRINPARVPDAYERTIWGLEKSGKTYSIGQLLRGRYVLRRKGKAMRQHKLASKGNLHLDLREILREEPRLLVTARRPLKFNPFVV